jgi:hypothetical protein
MTKGQYIYLSLLILTFLISLLKYPKYGRAYQFSLLCTLLGLGILTEIIQFYIKENKLPYNGLIYHFYNPLEYIFYALIYIQVYQSKTFKRAVQISIPLYLIYAIWGSLFPYSIIIGSKDPHNHILGGLLKVILALYYLFELYQDDNEISPISSSMFWITIGTLFYFSVSTIFMSIRDSLEIQNDALENILHFWFNTIPNCIMYIIYIIGLLCFRPLSNS